LYSFRASALSAASLLLSSSSSALGSTILAINGLTECQEMNPVLLLSSSNQTSSRHSDDALAAILKSFDLNFLASAAK
jgi:hypothetical protein